MVRIPIAEPLIGEEELANVEKAIRSGWISSIGEFIPQFEQGFAQYCQANHGISTSSGTTALHLALSALGIGEGDEVIVPALTFIATANAVTFTGAKPLFVDSHPEYWCMDPERIEQRITRRTKAIIPVHLYGHPCDMDLINAIAQAHNLWVIEDAAEAHGAEYRGKRVGALGDIACFSFFGNKIITTGEGGMCLTNNDELAQRLRTLRGHGKNPHKTYWHDVIGFNYRMTNLQAAVGVARLEKLDKLVERKKQLASRYEEALKDIAKRGSVTLPSQMPWAKSVYWMYSILLGDDFGITRDELIRELREGGIETRPLFYPLHILPPYQGSDRFPVAEELSHKGLSLPSGFRVGREEVAEISSRILSMSRTAV